MIKDIVTKFRARFTARSKQANPLVSAHHDIALLRHIRGKKRPNFQQLRHAASLMDKKEYLLLRLSILVLLIGIGWFGVVFSDRYRVQVPAVGGSYTEAIVGSPERVNPLFAPLNDADMDIVRLVYSGLMQIDTKQRVVPDLATSYEVNEDQTVYTFTLRDGIVWHDGEPMTAADVVFTIETIQDETVASPLRVTFQGIEVLALDEKTIQFTLSEPFAPFLSSLTVGILPEHIWGSMTSEQILASTKNLQPIGTGPFRFVKLTKTETGAIDDYQLERFEDYYRQAPFLETFTFSFYNQYEEDTGAIQALRQQQVDAIQFVPTALKPRVMRKHVVLHTLQLPEYTALFYNQNREPFLADLAVRTALERAIDKERILTETLDGEGEIIYSPILPGFHGHIADMAYDPYSSEVANELLDESWERITPDAYKDMRREALIEVYEQDLAAVETVSSTEEDVSTSTPAIPEDVMLSIEAQLDSELNDAQTFYRKNDDGEILELTLVTTDTPAYRSASQRIAGFWQAIGVHTIIEYVAPEAFAKDVLRKRSYDILLYGVIVGSDPDQYPFWHSSQIAFPGLNLAQYENEDVDEILETNRETTDPEVLAEGSAEFQSILYKEKPASFLYMPTYTYASSQDIFGQELSRIFIPSDRFAGIIHWYKKTKGVWQFK